MALAGITRHDVGMTQSIWNRNYLHPVKWDQQFPALALHDMFFQSAERMGRAAMADFMGRKYSYAEMAATVRRVARGLQDKGIGKGDQIGLFLPMCRNISRRITGRWPQGRRWSISHRYTQLTSWRIR